MWWKSFHFHLYIQDKKLVKDCTGAVRFNDCVVHNSIFSDISLFDKACIEKLVTLHKNHKPLFTDVVKFGLKDTVKKN